MPRLSLAPSQFDSLQRSPNSPRRPPSQSATRFVVSVFWSPMDRSAVPTSDAIPSGHAFCVPKESGRPSSQRPCNYFLLTHSYDLRYTPRGSTSMHRAEPSRDLAAERNTNLFGFCTSAPSCCTGIHNSFSFCTSVPDHFHPSHVQMPRTLKSRVFNKTSEFLLNSFAFCTYKNRGEGLHAEALAKARRYCAPKAECMEVSRLARISSNPRPRNLRIFSGLCKYPPRKPIVLSGLSNFEGEGGAISFFQKQMYGLCFGSSQTECRVYSPIPCLRAREFLVEMRHSLDPAEIILQRHVLVGSVRVFVGQAEAQ